MCGRYYRRSDKQSIANAFRVGKLPPGFELPRDYNIAPSTFQPVIRPDLDITAAPFSPNYRLNRSSVLSGDETDTHARYLEVMVGGIRIVDIYLPNGNPIGTEKFDYKLAWMERLVGKMSQWKADGVPTVIGGDFNVIPEDIDCHKPHLGFTMLSSNLNRERSTALC